MAAGTNKNVAVIAVIGVLVPCLIGLWFALPMFLPMYRWTKVNLGVISRNTNVPQAQLETMFKMQVRYNPRGEGDPMPWQIIESEPAWNTVHPTQEDESELLVRCTFISANDGAPPGTAFINSTYKDRYWKVEALRLPPGVLGFNSKRPVVIYDRMSMTRMDINSADMTQRSISGWENDDVWPERDDGWEPPAATP